MAVVCVARGWWIALAAGMAASAASAQVAGRPAGKLTRRVETPVALIDRVVVRVGPHGRVGPGPGGGPADDCNRSSTYTGVDFSNLPGQTVVAEAGMANGEMAAATYVLTAADFPLKISLAEIVFAGITSQQTTTGWSVLFWEGVPTGSAPAYTFSSDGEILPHLILPPGQVAGDLQFSIDPTDPEQIILNDNGTHSFTVAFRIDRLNQPSPSPCATGAPQCCNVFPAVDNDGLSNAANNWLFGINCGPFGCPANGGWARFSSLACRPSGDWVLRAQWQPINCTGGIGACCFPDGSCQVTTTANCSAGGGVYRGDNTDCATANCPQPTGACCVGNGNCLSLSQANCATAGGNWQGAGTQCDGSACPTGACCLPDGSCQTGMTQQECLAQNGIFRGVNSTCTNANCPQPGGACCLSSGGCLVLTQSDCALIGSGTWAGPGTSCTGSTCEQALCYPNCDHSTQPPVLNVNDFICFQTRFAAGDSDANCDRSTQPPVLNVNDFICFQTKFAAGCP